MKNITKMEANYNNIKKQEGEIFDNKYIIDKFLDDGGFSNVYKVIDNTNGKIYALKLFNEDNDIFKNEIKINKIIKEYENQYCIKFIDSSEGKTESPYIILEFASKGSALNYITKTCTGFNEKLCKFLFLKILIIVQSLHKMGICHRDLKLDNFLFTGDNFTIKISDFGLSSQIILDNNGKPQKQTGEVGTNIYKAPEMFIKNNYDGEKADIFSLGVVLFNLRTGKYGFTEAKQDNDLYKYIKQGKIKSYWNILGQIIDINDLTEDFKNLYIKIVTYSPEKRPSIQEIINDVWFNEIRNLSDKELKETELELIDELKAREEVT